MRYCPNCGSQVREGAFCGNCGAALSAARAADRPAASPYPVERVEKPSSSKALPIGLALILVGLVVLGVWWFVARRDQGGASPSSAAAPASSSAAPSSAASPTAVTPTDTGTPAPGSSSAAPAPTAPASAPGGANAPAGSWILVLDSLEQSKYSLDEANSRAQGIPGAVVVDSSKTPGLNGGYWAIVSTGHYASKQAASADCARYGRSASGACYPRRIG